jgi:hypothetical protein
MVGLLTLLIGHIQHCMVTSNEKWPPRIGVCNQVTMWMVMVSCETLGIISFSPTY